MKLRSKTRRGAFGVGIAAAVAFAVAIAIGVNAQTRPAGVYDNTPEEQEVLTLYQEQKLVTARTKAEKLLRRRPNSLIGNYVLGAVLHEAEGAHARAMHHLGRARELYETSWNAQTVPQDAPHELHREILYHIARVAREMELWEYEIEVLGYHDNLYDPDLIGERAWPLMQIGQIDEARHFAQTAIGSRNQWQRSSGLNALCAIEGLAKTRQPYYEACKAALEDARREVANRQPGSEDEGGGITVDAYNAAIAAMSALQHDEAETFALEGVRRLEFTPANPWRFLMYLYIAEGRFDEAIDALRSMQSWRRRQPANLREQSHAENDAALATMLLVGGMPDHAIDGITRALEQPDRRGLTTGTEEQERGHHALLRRSIRRAYIDYLAEEATWRGGGGPLLWKDRAEQRVAAWADSERIAGALAETDLLVHSVRPYVDQSITRSTFWLTGDLIEILGTGVFAIALEEARALDAQAPEVTPYYDALQAELEYRRGNNVEALEIIRRILTQLPPREVLLSARLCAVAALAAEADGDHAQALSFFEQVLQKDAGTLRRMGMALPASVQASGGDDADAAVSMIAASPRIEEDSQGFQIVVSAVGPMLRACLRSPRGNEIRCAEVLPLQEPEEPPPAPNGEEQPTPPPDPDAPPPLTLPQRLAMEFHTQVFSPQISISRVDLRSLDGRTTGASEAVREELEGLFEETVQPH